MSLKLIQDYVGGWGDETFTEATPLSVCHHLLKEAKELFEGVQGDHAAADVKEEAADVAILLLQLSHKLDFNLDHEIMFKMKKNRERSWGKPDADGVVEHIKEL